MRRDYALDNRAVGRAEVIGCPQVQVQIHGIDRRVGTFIPAAKLCVQDFCRPAWRQCSGIVEKAEMDAIECLVGPVGAKVDAVA